MGNAQNRHLDPVSAPQARQGLSVDTVSSVARASLFPGRERAPGIERPRLRSGGGKSVASGNLASRSNARKLSGRKSTARWPEAL